MFRKFVGEFFIREHFTMWEATCLSAWASLIIDGRYANAVVWAIVGMFSRPVITKLYDRGVR